MVLSLNFPRTGSAPPRDGFQVNFGDAKDIIAEEAQLFKCAKVKRLQWQLRRRNCTASHQEDGGQTHEIVFIARRQLHSRPEQMRAAAS